MILYLLGIDYESELQKIKYSAQFQMTKVGLNIHARKKPGYPSFNKPTNVKTNDHSKIICC